MHGVKQQKIPQIVKALYQRLGQSLLGPYRDRLQGAVGSRGLVDKTVSKELGQAMIDSRDDRLAIGFITRGKRFRHHCPRCIGLDERPYIDRRTAKAVIASGKRVNDNDLVAKFAVVNVLRRDAKTAILHASPRRMQ